MEDDSKSDDGPIKRERLVARLDHMVKSGRVTSAEAARLRSAGEPGEFEAGVRAIRMRHAGAQLRTAVAERGMTQEEADGHLEQLRSGEHPRGLRAHLQALRKETR